jgi:hypothetical protein
MCPARRIRPTRCSALVTRSAASKAIAVTWAGWASQSATLLSGANEVYDTSSWGTNYRVPVGENIPDSTDHQMFEYTGATIMAGRGGAEVQIDSNNDGTFNQLVILEEGESHLINGGLSVGARILFRQSGAGGFDHRRPPGWLRKPVLPSGADAHVGWQLLYAGFHAQLFPAGLQ